LIGFFFLDTIKPDFVIKYNSKNLYGMLNRGFKFHSDKYSFQYPVFS
jgi:hypothetical protein